MIFGLAYTAKNKHLGPEVPLHHLYKHANCDSFKPSQTDL